MDAKQILVVDDQPEIRELLREILEDRGYRVVEAGDGRQAMRAVESGRVDLMVTDLVMPEKEGLETITIMRRFQPGLKIIAMSGAAEGRYLRAARLMGAHETLRKPFDGATFVGAVERVLAEEAPAGR